MHRDKVGGDHKDVYCLGAMYGLHRLQPAQLAKLAKQLLAQGTLLSTAS